MSVLADRSWYYTRLVGEVGQDKVCCMLSWVELSESMWLKGLKIKKTNRIGLDWIGLDKGF